MPTAFDPGYGEEPFRSLVASYPGAIAYPAEGFRLEVGPRVPPRAPRRHGARARHRPGPRPARDDRPADPRRRGRPPAAGLPVQARHRPQLRDGQHLPLQRLRQRLEERRPRRGSPTYRHKWLDAVFAHEPIEAVVSLGTLADKAWLKWAATPAGQSVLARLPPHHAPHGARERRGEEPGRPRRADHEDARQLERRACRRSRPASRTPTSSAASSSTARRSPTATRSRSRWTTCRPARRSGWPPTTAGPTAPAPAGASRRSRSTAPTSALP